MAGGPGPGRGGGTITVRFPIKGPLGISFSATDAASPPLISAISATGLAATVRGLRVGLALVGVQGRSVERAGFDAAIAAIKGASRPLELVFAPPNGPDADASGGGSGGGDGDDGSFDSTSSGGLTGLMQAAAEGRDATAAALRDGADLDAQDNDGWTALHHACHAGDAGSVEELLRAGCAVDVEDDIGETAADVAEGGGHAALVVLLQQCVATAAASRPADEQAAAPARDSPRAERELRHARAEVVELQAALATERRCIQTLTDQAHVGRDEALASLLDELELARTQLQVSQRQHRELEERLDGGSSREEQDKTRLRLQQVEQVLSGMEERMADATKREVELEQQAAQAEAERSVAVSEATAARAESEQLDAKCRDQAAKLTQLRRRQSEHKEAAKQEEQRAADQALTEGAAGWEAQLREQAETVDTQGRKLRELSRQLAEHRVSKENATRDAETLRIENAQLRKTVTALEAEVKDHAAERRKAEQLQRMLNSERERAQAASVARNEQHELEVNAMKDEFAKLLEERDKRIAKLTKHRRSSGENDGERTPSKTNRPRSGGRGSRSGGKEKRGKKATTGVGARAGNPRQSPRRARAHAPARMSRSSPVAVPGGGAAITAEAPEAPAALSRAKALLEQAGSHEKKTQGIGREIKRIGRDTRRQQRQLSPEGPSGMFPTVSFTGRYFGYHLVYLPLVGSTRGMKFALITDVIGGTAHDRRRHTAAAANGSRRSVSASPAKRRPVPSSPATVRAGSAGSHGGGGRRSGSTERQQHKRPSSSPSRTARHPQLSSKAEEQVERLYINDVERREQWRAQRLAEQEAEESKQVRSTSRRRPVQGDEVKKRWDDIQGAQRRKAEWVAAQKAKEEEMEEKELEQQWVMSKGSATGGK